MLAGVIREAPDNPKPGGGNLIAAIKLKAHAIIGESPITQEGPLVVEHINRIVGEDVLPQLCNDRPQMSPVPRDRQVPSRRNQRDNQDEGRRCNCDDPVAARNEIVPPFQPEGRQ